MTWLGLLYLLVVWIVLGVAAAAVYWVLRWFYTSEPLSLLELHDRTCTGANCRGARGTSQPSADHVDAGPLGTDGRDVPVAGPVDPPAASAWAPYADLPEWEQRRLAGDR